MYLLFLRLHLENDHNLLAKDIKTKFVITDKINEDIKGIFFLGGDGTLLKHLRELEKKQVKYLNDTLLICINCGSYGGLIPFENKETEKILNRIKRNEIKILKRKRLQVFYKGKEGFESFGYALNDVLLTRRDIGKLNTFKITINNIEIGILKCDSILISTSSGSTGYNYSLRGPVLFDDNNFIVNCFNPCQIYFNPLIVKGEVKIEILENEFYNSETVGLVDGFDEVVDKKEFVFKLEEGYINFASFDEREVELCKSVKKLWYLK